MTEWQDMATAPKDGTCVLVFVPQADQPKNLPIGSWVIAYAMCHGHPFVTSWKHASAVGRGQACGYPTHWQPLPDPPALKETER